jgi:hypothetical protein
MKDPARADRGCAAKTAVVRALEALAAPEDAIYLAGIRHVQMEGSFGPPIETAAAFAIGQRHGPVPTHCDHLDELPIGPGTQFPEFRHIRDFCSLKYKYSTLESRVWMKKIRKKFGMPGRDAKIPAELLWMIVLRCR